MNLKMLVPNVEKCLKTSKKSCWFFANFCSYKILIKIPIKISRLSVNMQVLPIFFPLLITSLHAIPRGRRAVRVSLFTSFLPRTTEYSNFQNRNEGDINSLVGVGQYLYQGDIAVVKSRARRAVIRQKHKKWKLPMPYSFDRNFREFLREKNRSNYSNLYF